MTQARLEKFIMETEQEIEEMRREDKVDKKSEAVLSILKNISKIYKDSDEGEEEPMDLEILIREIRKCQESSSSSGEPSVAPLRISPRRRKPNEMDDKGPETSRSQKSRRRQDSTSSEEDSQDSEYQPSPVKLRKSSSPVKKEIRSTTTEKQSRTAYYGVDDKRMWSFVMKNMRYEKSNGIQHFNGKPAKGMAIWKDYCRKYATFDGIHENSHTPASLQSRFRRDLFPNMANAPLNWENKIEYLLHSKYQITKEFRKKLEEESGHKVVCDAKGVVIRIEAKVKVEEPEGGQEQEEDAPEAPEVPEAVNEAPEVSGAPEAVKQEPPEEQAEPELVNLEKEAQNPTIFHPEIVKAEPVEVAIE